MRGDAKVKREVDEDGRVALRSETRRRERGNSGNSVQQLRRWQCCGREARRRSAFGEGGGAAEARGAAGYDCTGERERVLGLAGGGRGEGGGAPGAFRFVASESTKSGGGRLVQKGVCVRVRVRILARARVCPCSGASSCNCAQPARAARTKLGEMEQTAPWKTRSDPLSRCMERPRECREKRAKAHLIGRYACKSHMLPFPTPQVAQPSSAQALLAGHQGTGYLPACSCRVARLNESMGSNLPLPPLLTVEGVTTPWVDLVVPCRAVLTGIARCANRPQRS